jgi:HNH endonuclease
MEHIIARQHGGSAHLDNLAFARWHCNRKKGPNLAGIDPVTGEIVALFHPRRDKWDDHFVARLSARGQRQIEIEGLTAVGRATVGVLGMNEEMRQMLRYEIWCEGLYTISG